MGSGIFVGQVDDGNKITVARSTISGNSPTGSAGSSTGGGIAFGGNGPNGAIRGDFQMIDSTISGNAAANGGGVSVGTSAHQRVVGDQGSISFDNSTIASNSAGSHGGGFYLDEYDSPSNPGTNISATPLLNSTIVAANTATGGPQDLDRIDGSAGGGLDEAFSLVQAPGDAPLIDSGSNLTGVDPLLAPLADNGGPTKTQLPAITSPAIDKGRTEGRLRIDQRELARIVDVGTVANAVGGDGTDIGAVELAPGAFPPPPPPPKPPVDKKPLAVITKNHLTAHKAKKRTVSGTASDDHRVATVQVAILMKVHGRCRAVLGSGKLGKRRSCSLPTGFRSAAGTNKWSYRLQDALPAGSYVVFARATDNKGQKQTSFGHRSKRSFKVR
jgi:hypothetical protein